MRYVFSLKDQLPVLQDYTKGLVPELNEQLISKIRDEEFRFWSANLKRYFDRCLPSMLLSALISLVIYDSLAPSGNHMVKTYLLLNDLLTAQLEADTNEGDLYVGQPIGIDIRSFEDVCDVAAVLANAILDFIETIGILEFDYFIEICQATSHQLSRVYRYGINEIRIAEILLSKNAVILTGDQSSYVKLF